MKLKTLPFLALAFGVANCEKPVERVTLDANELTEIKLEIQAIEDRYAKAVNSKNIDSIMEYYADDAVSFDSNSKPLHGKDEIRESMQDLSKGFPKRAGIKYTVMEVFPSGDGTQVVEIGHYRISDPKGINYGTGNYFSVFEKRNGKYVCIRDIQTPDDAK
ncbi:YybH family protein [Flavobacterium selenitireducens]|uniref:YybH family protein n=1 Tax=Flavobacterium selenitireducens TaxID=2722704 RepID=UPI00168B0F2B|nr:nuclear transport factor 2 family protein [Flavobacterium selenitireducens]MBD3582264.1 nuclear transport factor 2 family protein [Flavobacterium selenitireducens]